MKIAVDTNPLIYALNGADPNHPVAVRAMNTLASSGHTFCLFPQCLYEFWSVMTKRNKQGISLMSPPAAHAEMRRYKTLFEFLPDKPDLYDQWENQVLAYQVIRPEAFDTRIASAVIVHGVTHILTFNGKHFARYPNITVIDPATV